MYKQIIISINFNHLIIRHLRQSSSNTSWPLSIIYQWTLISYQTILSDFLVLLILHRLLSFLIIIIKIYRNIFFDTILMLIIIFMLLGLYNLLTFDVLLIKKIFFTFVIQFFSLCIQNMSIDNTHKNLKMFNCIFFFTPNFLWYHILNK